MVNEHTLKSPGQTPVVPLLVPKNHQPEVLTQTKDTQARQEVEMEEVTKEMTKEESLEAPAEDIKEMTKEVGVAGLGETTKEEAQHQEQEKEKTTTKATTAQAQEAEVVFLEAEQEAEAEVETEVEEEAEVETDRGGGRGGSRGGGRGGKMPTFDPTDFIKKAPQKEEIVEKYVAKNTFKTFGLDNMLVKTIVALKMTIPTPIQDQIIPYILKNKDVIALAETGTGKTAAFLIPLIEKTIKNMNHRTLILVPTRELAVQVTREIFLLTKNLNMHSVMCVGGMDIRPQIKKLSRAHQFVIATPGRALDLIKKRFILAEKFNTVVLDEADRMLDMGFITDMRKILEKTPETRETLLFSATMNQASEKLADDFLKNPVTVSVKKTDSTINIEQSIVHYQNNNKFDTLLDLLKNKDFKRVLVFGSRKHSAQKLAEQLNDNKIPTESIHGNKSHNHRQRALQNFKDGTHKVIVATDVVARGIHVNNISHVINYDLPNTVDDYIHRIGRTGRAGQKGKAITFIQSRG